MKRTLPDMSRGELEKRLDKEISFAVRAGLARETGYEMIPCYTCGVFLSLEEARCGTLPRAVEPRSMVGSSRHTAAMPDVQLLRRW